MVSEFKWPSTIPSGQRTYKTPSCVIRKNIKSIIFEDRDHNFMDLFEDTNFDENTKLIFITGAIGIFCGVKNSLYAGYVSAAAENEEEIEIDEHIYSGCKLHIIWNSDNKQNVTIFIRHLLDVVGILNSSVYMSTN